MGFETETFKSLADVVRRSGAPAESCLSLGKQDVELDVETLLSLSSEFGFQPAGEGDRDSVRSEPLRTILASDRGYSKKPEGKAKGWVSDLAMFAALGFKTIHSVDVSKYEGADYAYDLNAPGLAQFLGRRYDFVVDGGTTEHIFHVPNVLENIFEVLDVGGCVVHMSPMNNYVDHGFYQFSPTLFFDFYSANRFEVCSVKISTSYWQASEESIKTGPSREYESREGLPRLSYVLDSNIYDLCFTARKTELSSGNVIPQQQIYSDYADKPDLAFYGDSIFAHPALAGAGKVVIWGTGRAIDSISYRLDKERIAFFVDASGERQKELYHGLPVHRPEALAGQTECVVLIGSLTHEDAIRRRIEEDFRRNVARIVTLSEVLRS